MMSLWDALRMNMMISYQELVRTFLSFYIKSTLFNGHCIFIIPRITYTINREMKNSPVNN